MGIAMAMEDSLAASTPILPTECALCPRACGADRAAGERGFCGAGDSLDVARAALHFWEEPPLSGERGSGAVFFANCPLRCSYCQNATIAAGRVGKAVSVDHLADMFLDLQMQRALNINLVTPTHYAPQVREAIRLARLKGLVLPVVWNTSGYETVDAIRANADAVDVYLTDFKYAGSATASRYSHAPDYPAIALAALDEMLAQKGVPVFDEVEGMPRLVSGVVVRHLMLPDALDESMRVVRLVHERYGSAVLLSLMNQYTSVLAGAAAAGDEGARSVLRQCPELARTVSGEDYERLLDYADSLGLDDYFWQQGQTAAESFIPSFDLTGVR